MKNILIPIATVFLAIALAACAGDLQPSATVQGPVMGPTAQVQTATATSSAIATAPSQPTQPKQEYLVYGVKTVVYSMSDFDATQQNIPLYQYIDQNTDIFIYSVEQQATKLIFSDRSLPVFILNTSGGGETAIHDIVAADPGSGMLFARMMPRNQYTSHGDAGALYELSTDGTNQYKKLFNFDSPDSFALSPDATKIASILNDFLVVRRLPSGVEVSRIPLNEFKNNWISKISWAPDGNSLLLDVAAGETSLPPAAPYSQTNGCYLVNTADQTINKIGATVFQTPVEINPGFMTDPASFAFFPRSNRLMGMASKYNARSNAVELFSVDMQGSNLVTIPIRDNASVWEVNTSPDEQNVAYQCGRVICMTHINNAGSEVVSQSPSAEQEQTVIGWLMK